MINTVLKTAYKALDSKFAQNIVVMDIQEISLLSDYFIVASGNNSNQLQAMAKEVEEKLFKQGVNLVSSEGLYSNWVLLNFGDIMVHLFSKDERSFYNLEKVWGDAKTIDCSSL